MGMGETVIPRRPTSYILRLLRLGHCRNGHRLLQSGDCL